VSVRTAPCPGCGATLEFKNAGTITITCPYCGSASWRSDMRLEELGKVAALAPIESPLELGTYGRIDGVSWTAVGQVQLDHGAGPWNEWCLLLDDGTWRWLAEAQGELLLTRPVPEAKDAIPPYSTLKPGADVHLGDAGEFTVAEIGQAKVTTVRGELPVRIAPGGTVRYADLRASGGGFGTLDYGDGTQPPAAYAGKKIAGPEIGIDPAAVASPKERRASATRLACPQCGGIIELRDPKGAVRVVCASCGSLIDPTHAGAKALGVGAALSARPQIPLGTKANFGGGPVEVIAFLVRSVKSEGIRYRWREYLLRTPVGGYRWLVTSKGHWSLGDPVNVADVRVTFGVATHDGRVYRHFQRGDARVDHVQGEVYWAVTVKDEVRSDDYVSPPYMLTVEEDGKERNVTRSEYVPHLEVATAFRVALEEPVGVAPTQPNPSEGSSGPLWLAFFVFLVATFVIASVLAGKPGAGGGEWVMAFVAVALLAIPPIVSSTKNSNFERLRWQDSDHPYSGGWSSSEDGGGDDEE
jgi:predicted RNA-binding Zn-ribbon protein involved in translation (DUF1610 family)